MDEICTCEKSTENISKWREALAKLKREWKTFVLAVCTFLVGVWDAGASVYDYRPLVPPEYQQFVPLVLGVGFIVLRKYVDANKT